MAVTYYMPYEEFEKIHPHVRRLPRFEITKIWHHIQHRDISILDDDYLDDLLQCAWTLSGQFVIVANPASYDLARLIHGF